MLQLAVIINCNCSKVFIAHSTYGLHVWIEMVSLVGFSSSSSSVLSQFWMNSKYGIQPVKT